MLLLLPKPQNPTNLRGGALPGHGQHGPVPQRPIRSPRLALQHLAEGGGEAVPFVESSEYLLGADVACADTFLDHGLEAMLEDFAAVGEWGRRAGGPGSPRAVGKARVGFHGLGEVDVAGEMRAFIPVGE